MNQEHLKLLLLILAAARKRYQVKHEERQIQVTRQWLARLN
jgi:hypothetical protein